MFNIGEMNDHLIENYTELNSMDGFSVDSRSIWGVWWTDEDYYLVSPGPALPVHFEFASFPYPNPARRCQEDNIGLDLTDRSISRTQVFSGITGELLSDDYLGEFCPEADATRLMLWDGHDGSGNCLSIGPKIARVTAYRGGNSFYSDIELNVLGESMQKPPNPSNLSLSLVDNYVLLSWEDNATDEIGFTIERRAGSCAFTQLTELDSNPGTGSVEYMDYEIATGETYIYRVVTRGDGGRSGPSNLETVFIPACADNPYMITSGPTILADTVFSSESYQVEVETNDSDCPFVQYEWSVHSNQYSEPGTIVGSGSRVTYTAPTLDCDQLSYPAFRNTIDVTTRYLGRADSSSTDWFVIRCPHPDTTGCPFLYVWDGKGFFAENNLLPASELTSSSVVDYYALRGRAAPVDGEYLLEIREDEREHSTLDKIELLFVDHPARERIGVTHEGRIISYTDLIQPASATDLAGEDLLPGLLEADGDASAGSTGDEVKIAFDHSGPGVLVLFVIPGEKKKSPGPRIIPGDGRGPGGGNGGAIYLPRLVGGYQFFDVQAEADEEGGARFSLFWPEPVSLDYVGMTGNDSRAVAGMSLRLNRAVHSAEGEVSERLDNVDGQAVTLDPGERIDLFFEAPSIAGGLKRDLIVAVHGRYDR